MIRYVIKRVLMLIPIILAISFIVFTIMDFSPGDPVYAIVGDGMTQEQIEEFREAMGFNDPLLVRYGRYMWDVLHGDMGKSLYGEQDIFTNYMTRLPTTIYLAVVAMALTIVVAVPLGILAAVKQNTWIDSAASAFAVLGLSMPNFWLGLLLVILFSVNLGWLPSTGAESPKSIILPAIACALANMALIMRTTRSAMLDVIRQDYLRTARAKGVSERRVILHHALRNALIPIVTMIGGQFTVLLGGAVVIETVFAWPGIGYMIVTAIKGTDYTTVTSAVLLTTIFVAIVLLLVDILYAFIDPRIKAQYSK
ncbi:MAG: ABC transporter permease [Oscillospiraceae bacterium]